MNKFALKNMKKNGSYFFPNPIQYNNNSISYNVINNIRYQIVRVMCYLNLSFLRWDIDILPDSSWSESDKNHFFTRYLNWINQNRRLTSFVI